MSEGKEAPERIWIGDTRSWFTYKSEFHDIEYARVAESTAEKGDDLCSICHLPMQVPSVVNAIFGAHEKCLTTERSDYQLARITWEAICDEIAKGGDRPSTDIIASAFALVRAASKSTAEKSEGWNEAIEAAAKVADKVGLDACQDRPLRDPSDAPARAGANDSALLIAMRIRALAVPLPPAEEKEMK